MKNLRASRFAIASAFVFALTACGGGGGGGGASAVPQPVATLPNGITQAILSFTIPSLGASARRHAKYIPASSNGLAASVNGTPLPLQSIQGGCANGSTVRCLFYLTVPAGTDSIDIYILGTSTKPVSHASFTQNMPAGVATPIHPTFHGIVAAATLIADKPYPLVGTPKTLNLSINALDADGNTISGDPFDTPVTIALAAPNSHVTLPSNLTYTTPTDTIAINYDGHNMVQQATFALASNGAIGTSTPFYPEAFQSFGPISSFVTSVALGANGAAWFIACAQGNAGPCHPGSIVNGSITEFATLPYVGTGAVGTLGPDGNMWFTDGDPFPTGSSEYVYRVTPSGTETGIPLHSLGPAQGAETYAITSGPDGNIWVGEADRIDRVTPSGVVTSFPLDGYNRPHSLTLGPDGRLWFDDWASIGAITMSGTISYYPLQSGNHTGSNVAFASDGNLYFTLWVTPQYLMRMSTNGVQSIANAHSYPTNSYGTAVVEGLDGNIWSTTTASMTLSPPMVGGVGLNETLMSETPTGLSTYYYAPPGDNASFGSHISLANDGSLWSGVTNYVTRFIYNP